VIASDLGRVLETASIAGLEPEKDPAWREVALGDWEGLTRDEVHERFPEQIAALTRGEMIRLGGGESWPEFGARIDGALDRLIDGLEDGQRVAVVAHGGVVASVVSGLLGFRGQAGPWRIGAVANTAITRIVVEDGVRQIRVFNDATHTVVDRSEPGTLLGLVRHGESEGNVLGAWQGRTDGPLTDEGRRQAARLAAWYDGLDHLYSSPLSRARDTATVLGDAHGLEPILLDDVVEMSFGAWDGMTTDEILQHDAAAFVAAFEHDHPRGETGETFVGVGRRMRAALEGIAAGHPDAKVGVVSHGGAIRAFAASLVGLEHATRQRLALPDNTSVSHVRFGAEGPVLVDYNTAGG
jgi:broad specificity phosphatase PhoE